MTVRNTGQTDGFTLIEMIAVIAIILILAGLLLPVLSSARTRAKVFAAETEARQIETAWLLYLAEYQVWPSNVISDEAHAYPLTGDLAQLLEGRNTDANPKEIPFMRFERYDSTSNPISPFGSRTLPSDDDRYYCQFDVNYDNLINNTNQPSSEVRRSVIVWTYNKNVPATDPHRTIRSWNQ